LENLSGSRVSLSAEFTGRTPASFAEKTEKLKKGFKVSVSVADRLRVIPLESPQSIDQKDLSPSGGKCAPSCEGFEDLSRPRAPHSWRDRVEAGIHSSGQILRDWNVALDEVVLTGAVEGLLGVSSAEIPSGIEGWIGRVHPDDRASFRAALEAAKEGHGAVRCEYRIAGRDDGYLNVREQGKWFCDGEVWHLTSLVADISWQKQLEDELRHAQRMEAFGQLAGGMAHDFNNMLSVIMGYIQLVLDDCPEGDPQREYLVEIEKATHRASSLTDQLLAFSRKEAQREAILDLNQVLGEVAKMLKRLIGEQITLEVQEGGCEGRVKGDLCHLEQVFINLAVSARDAMPSGGTVRFSTSDAIVREGEVICGRNPLPPGAYVLLTVSESPDGPAGEGLGAKWRKETGLGVNACHEIIRRNGGHIALSDAGSNPAVTRVYFPRVDVPKAKPDVAKDHRGTETILLVEDDSAVRGLAMVVLSRFGYSVLEASNGEEALALLATKPDVRVALLITDLVMPRMGGVELARRVEEIYPGTKVLFSSGYPDQTVPMDGVGGRCGFFEKPFIPRNFAAKVREMLDS